MRLRGVVGLIVVPLAVAALAAVPWAATGATAPTTTYTDPDAFAAAIDDVGDSTIVDFDNIDASPCNNTHVGRTPFSGSTYSEEGITFASPNSASLYIAPGCLFWNESNSLALAHFPWDEIPDDSGNDDDLTVRLRPSAVAVGFTLVDNDSNDADEFVQFLDRRGRVITQVGLPANFSEFRAFVGIVSKTRRIAMIKVAERAFDEDDVNYDDFVLVRRGND